MSGKRSFDIGPARTSGRSHKPQTRRKRRTKASPVKKVKAPKTLRARREEARQRSQLFVSIVFLLIAGGVIYLFWRPEVRIQEVHAVGIGDAAAIEALAEESLTGTYWYVFPRDSFFFYPEKEIRSAILDANPKVVSLSISRGGFTKLTLETVARESAFWWCGTPDVPITQNCYDTDADGFVFAPAAFFGTTTDILRMRGFLDTSSTTDSFPLRARVIGSDHVPDVLLFAKTIAAFGTPITSIAIRGDEVDLFTEGGTRITYVLGKEAQATADARAAFPNLNLVDGSLEYIDLRFEGKVYIRRRGE